MIFFTLMSLALATPLLTWEQYKVKFEKKYANRLEHDTRQAAFQANVEKIKKHNSEVKIHLFSIKFFWGKKKSSFSKKSEFSGSANQIVVFQLFPDPNVNIEFPQIDR